MCLANSYFLIERTLDIQTEHVFPFLILEDKKDMHAMAANLCGAGEKRCGWTLIWDTPHSELRKGVSVNIPPKKINIFFSVKTVLVIVVQW